jgi:hypothetical protein
MAQNLNRFVPFHGADEAAIECARDVAAVIEDIAHRHFDGRLRLQIEADGTLDGQLTLKEYRATIESAAANEYIKGGYQSVFRLKAAGEATRLAESTKTGHEVEAIFSGIGVVIGVSLGFLVAAFSVPEAIWVCGFIGFGCGAVVGHLLADSIQGFVRRRSKASGDLKEEVDRWSAFLAELEPQVDTVLASRQEKRLA